MTFYYDVRIIYRLGGERYLTRLTEGAVTSAFTEYTRAKGYAVLAYRLEAGKRVIPGLMRENWINR